MNVLFDTRYYRVTKMFCSFVGLWPYQPQNKRRIMQSLQMFILYFTFVPPQMVRIYQVWNKDLDAMCTCLGPILILILCTIKIVTIDQFDLEIRTILRQIETDWEITTGKEEYKILVKYTTKSRKLCIVYSTVLCNGLLCFILLPTFSPILDIILPQNETRVRILAFDVDYGIDQQHYWFWLWLHVSTAGTIAVFNILAADILYVTLTIHVSCLFAIARHKLEHMTKTMEKNSAQSFKTSNYDMEYDTYRHDEDIPLKLEKQAMVIRECVISHRKAIGYMRIALHRLKYCTPVLRARTLSNLIDQLYIFPIQKLKECDSVLRLIKHEIEKTLCNVYCIFCICISVFYIPLRSIYTHLLHRIYTWSLLATVGVSMISISILAVQLVSKLFRWAEMLFSITYVITGLIHLYLLTLMAQNILDESTKIHESIFSSSWYNMPIKFWKDIVFILMSSHIPCKLTAGKIFVISLENFCTILQTSMSYFTLLASFR